MSIYPTSFESIKRSFKIVFTRWLPSD